MRQLLALLRPMAYLRRRALYAGILGGKRRWLIWGGAAWILHGLRSVLGKGAPTPVHTEELRPGERLVVLHNPTRPSGSRQRR